MPRLILASASPRRVAMMREAGYSFDVRPSDVDESVAPGTSPEVAAVELAKRKARAVDAADAWVLAADTLLDLDGAILGKPQDAADARRILARLSGRAHRILTGVAVRHAEEVRSAVESTRVTFRALTDAELDEYVASGEPMGKAGAYAIQGRARAFVARIEGPEDNVIGLPMALARRLLDEAGFPVQL